jgi:hypothetical protein
MNTQWAPSQYREFYDIPRAFVVERAGDLLFFDCPFNDSRDDYEPEYTVFKIQDAHRDKVDQPSWLDLRRYGERIGAVPTGAVTFDETRRRAIDTSVFASL